MLPSSGVMICRSVTTTGGGGAGDFTCVVTAPWHATSESAKQTTQALIRVLLSALDRPRGDMFPAPRPFRGRRAYGSSSDLGFSTAAGLALDVDAGSCSDSASDSMPLV